jgi:hypothetical protein
MNVRLLKFFAISLVAAGLAGCASYEIGPVNGMAAGEKSIEILPFNNQTLQQHLGDAVTQALRERIQVDGTYRLASHNDGDIVITGVITRYRREGLSYLAQDAATTEDYRVSIITHVIARERDSGKVVLDKDVSGYTLVHVGLSLADAERQAAPLLAEDLARSITGLITEGAW